jgi:DNA repair photolyase
MSSSDRLSAVGRGAQTSPPNRFERIHVEATLDQVEHDEEYLHSLRLPPTEYYVDQAQSIVTQNDSPDIPFNYSVNAYRGCAHGCAYCYARPTHEYLGFSAGLDFETKIFVKEQAPQLLRKFLSNPRWRPEPITMSGVTDCYQPAERHFRLTRQCLEVALEARQPVTIITKNALVLRDLDLLGEMAALNLVMVALSITSLDQSLTRVLEPRTSAPAARLRAVSELTAAGVPVLVMMAPLIPGLTDDEMSAILEAAAAHGAVSAAYTMLRLPLTVRPVFLDWLEQHAPTKKQRVENLLRWIRDGGLNDAQFGVRMRGTGVMADQIDQLFGMLKKKFKLDRSIPPLDTSAFRPPTEPGGQMRLF